jgi:hypothetical protein
MMGIMGMVAAMDEKVMSKACMTPFAPFLALPWEYWKLVTISSNPRPDHSRLVA